MQIAILTATRYPCGMTLAAIKSAIEELPKAEKDALVDWLLNRERKERDEQIIEDFVPGGRGASLFEEVDATIDRGDFKPH